MHHDTGIQQSSNFAAPTSLVQRPFLPKTTAAKTYSNCIYGLGIEAACPAPTPKSIQDIEDIEVKIQATIHKFQVLEIHQPTTVKSTSDSRPWTL
mmetsp:Transcript_80485/g.98593  ORF Transcript_80485/g.98593 Transcript_80485/m.98593 type:complete len:95 (-) Transcript_80485:235-519(-)